VDILLRSYADASLSTKSWDLATSNKLCVLGLMRRHRRERLARIRATWGASIERPRRMDAMFTSHAARVAAFTGSRSLDERTWVDLNLDSVFAAIDRTQSTSGQYALYHRLRTVPVADHLGAFEALVRRMTLDSASREPAQLALARLQDPQGYDIWWLADPHAVERRSWYAIFPLLTSAAVIFAALAPFWSVAVVPLVTVISAQRGGSLRDRYLYRHSRAQLSAMRSLDCGG
jgi:hypothetical protein